MLNDKKQISNLNKILDQIYKNKNTNTKSSGFKKMPKDLEDERKKRENSLKKQEFDLKRYVFWAVIIFLIFSFCGQIKFFFEILENKCHKKDLWKILAVITGSFTAIFVTVIIGVFKAQTPKSIVSLNP
ncbi:MAG: hypothetical protein GDA46_00015 [Bdellovibrionales bacterium]|nr:hypothetical protein [Bdellovibrionales bacterium]